MDPQLQLDRLQAGRSTTGRSVKSDPQSIQKVPGQGMIESRQQVSSTPGHIFPDR